MDSVNDYSETLTVCTPIADHRENFFGSHARENLHMLLMVDDLVFVEHQISSLGKKGVKMVTLPTIYDAKNILPFLLINDHSILVVKNPKKDIIPLLKSIILTGQYQK